MVSVDRHFINFFWDDCTFRAKSPSVEISKSKHGSDFQIIIVIIIKKTDLKKAKIKFGILFNLDTIIFISLF